MNRRALFVALVIGVLGVVLLLLYQRRFETEASGGEKVRLLFVVKQIDRNKPISDDMLAVREVPLSYVEDRAVKESEKASVIGLTVANTVRAQQTLMWTDIFSGSDVRRELSSLVKPGMRAVSVKLSRDESSTSLIRPGDYVDVIGVLATGSQPTSAQDGQRSASVLLQHVLVLATGTATSIEQIENREKEKKGYSWSDSNLTLSLTLAEGQLLALASERGRLSVALRSPDDPRTAERVPDFSWSAVANEEQRSKVIRNGPIRIGGNP